MKQYIQFIQDKEKQLLDLIKEVVEIESPTSLKEQNDLLGEIISNLFINYTGGTIEKVKNDQYGNHLIGTVGDGDEQILLVGHFDTVHPIDTLKHNSYRLKEGKIFGPGIYDMKAGLIQGIFALHALVELNGLGNKRIKFIFNADEEVGSPTSKEILINEAKNSKVAFVLEPSFGQEGAIKMERKGVGTYTIKAYGKSAHAGNAPEEGENAIEEISRQVIRLQELNDFKRGITVNCGVIHGGTTKNTIPDFAELKIDVRVSTMEDLNEIDTFITQITPFNSKIKVSIEGGFTRPPMESSLQTEELYKRAKQFMEIQANLPLPRASVGGASDGNIISQYVPTLDGLGAVGDGAHTLEEYIYKEHLVPRTALLAALIAIA
ncbi:M20 family metallopeptidase [Sporosarcina sp. FSL W8-0480]|uniref:M20 family metallopeptidase n=1 Tax=Sporosarcina sp. FSL W8-0480 TaxID=2954701 RepID=UPI0030D7E916